MVPGSNELRKAIYGNLTIGKDDKGNVIELMEKTILNNLKAVNVTLKDKTYFEIA